MKTSLDLINKQLEYIPDYVFDLINLKTLDLSYNEISVIPDQISKLTNLEVLFLESNNFNKIPENIKYLTNLKRLYLSQNGIYIIPNDSYNQYNQYNQFEHDASTILNNLTNLEILDLTDNWIQIFPENINNLTKLKNLNLSRNPINVIPENISNLTNLEILDLSCNQLSIFPDYISNLTNLKELNLVGNIISVIPDCIGNLTNLRKLFLISHKGYIKEISINIINCRRLKKINLMYPDNIPPIITRFILNIKNINNLKIFNDEQNIHDNSIQESIRNSIFNIIKQKIEFNEENIIDNILNDENLTCKELLIEYCDNNDYHSTLFVTFKELLCNVWTLINNNNEIKKILNIEMLDSECKCFTGRLSRLINCLNGYSDLVKIKISEEQEISNIIIMIKKKLNLNNEYTIEKHKEYSLIELKERGYDDNIINEWLEYID